jgi:uncharacterized protein (TIGR04552 family)
MDTKLTLGDVECVRLILRGGTVIDWRRLNVSSVKDCTELLRANEFDPEDGRDAARLSDIHRKAVDYLERNFAVTFANEVANAASTIDLMLLAAGRDRTLQPQACMVLKLMHIINHIEARELRARLPVSNHDLFQLVEEKAARVVQEMKARGFPILAFLVSQKTRDSLITKFLGKRQTIRAHIYDRVRLRIVTASVNDIVPVVLYMSKHLFPFNYTVPGESHNSIFDFSAFSKLHPRIKEMVPDFQIDLKFENEMRPPANENTPDVYRTINFVVDLPVRLDKHPPRSLDPSAFPAIVHVSTEFQIVDQVSHARNECGEASHARYEARRMAKVRERLLHGRMKWRGTEST